LTFENGLFGGFVTKYRGQALRMSELGHEILANYSFFYSIEGKNIHLGVLAALTANF
jgi:hypothetical protein